MTEKNIILYGLSTCIHCKHVKEYLKDGDIDFTSVLVDTLEGEERKEAIEAVKKVNPALSFPTLVIGAAVIVGFKQDEIDAALEA